MHVQQEREKKNRNIVAIRLPTASRYHRRRRRRRHRRHHGGVTSRVQHIVEHTGDNRTVELEPGGETAADRQDPTREQGAMQELSGRHPERFPGFATAADQHRRLRLHRSGHGTQDTEPDRLRQTRDGAQDRDRACEIEGGHATEAARAEKGSVRRLPGDEGDTCHAGEARNATGTHERGK